MRDHVRSQAQASQCIAGKANYFQRATQSTSQEAPADQSASQGQKCFVNVRPLFVANAQPPELIQPSEGPFDYPSPSAQSAAMFGVALREPRHDAAGTQTLPDCLSVITTVA